MLIIGMPYLMYRGQNSRNHIVLEIFRSGTAVIFTGPGSKGMLGLILIAPGGVKMQVLQKPFHKLLLLFHREALGQEILSKLLGLGHLLNKRHQSFL